MLMSDVRSATPVISMRTEGQTISGTQPGSRGLFKREIVVHTSLYPSFPSGI